VIEDIKSLRCDCLDARPDNHWRKTPPHRTYSKFYSIKALNAEL